MSVESQSTAAAAAFNSAAFRCRQEERRMAKFHLHRSTKVSSFQKITASKWIINKIIAS